MNSNVSSINYSSSKGISHNINTSQLHSVASSNSSTNYETLGDIYGTSSNGAYVNAGTWTNGAYVDPILSSNGAYVNKGTWTNGAYVDPILSSNGAYVNKGTWTNGAYVDPVLSSNGAYVNKGTWTNGAYVDPILSSNGAYVNAGTWTNGAYVDPILSSNGAYVNAGTWTNGAYVDPILSSNGAYVNSGITMNTPNLSGYIDSTQVDFSKIASAKSEVLNKDFINENNVFKEYWQGEKLKYQADEDGAVLISKGDVPMGWTTLDSINFDDHK